VSQGSGKRKAWSYRNLSLIGLMGKLDGDLEDICKRISHCPEELLNNSRSTICSSFGSSSGDVGFPPFRIIAFLSGELLLFVSEEPVWSEQSQR
jgi:hypothetical protein